MTVVSQTGNYFYNTDDSLWDKSWSSLFEPEDDNSWMKMFRGSAAPESETSMLGNMWQGTKDFANTQVGAGIIGGAISGIGEAYKQNKMDDQFNQTRTDTNAWREQQLALQEKLGMAGIGVQRAILADKIKTRAKHNKTIGAKNNAAKKISF